MSPATDGVPRVREITERRYWELQRRWQAEQRERVKQSLTTDRPRDVYPKRPK